ncbi:hypothetical protein GCM10025882_31850 [Acinetobacter gyllenbergii]|uniref:Phage protein n=1 Tax=Acinetobacter gyllenbergii CIP 110306 = MTCC 11365 TaxID=1217657 RepID=A0A829HD79_9GAMM|nr:hypothetical protein [Acinetobacter gyllenbergii]EPF72559.1 hypothetical protein F957_03695 [Acinetobacter gyllenbergii CIP 110306 = MTCC 11365]EPH31084.1 hypothetical protein L293_2487 [Acinetobacter gyllenbergii CIP 110306 = MTCC 11365]GMA12760.1 hypothetical protein GCM10025882_31850 [Acinetobacter gyllenbergii]
MSLPFIVDSLDQIKEEHRALYVEENGKFRLDLDGYEDPKGLKSALQSERDAAKTAKQELQRLQKQFEGIDPEIVKKVFAQIDQDEEAKLIAEGKVNEVIQKRTEKMREEHAKLLNAETTRANNAEAYANKFKQSVVQGQIVQAAVELEALPEATADIAFLAQSKFALDEDGKAVAVDELGEVVIGKDGKTPLSPKEWVESLREQKPYFWPKANGTGAPGSTNTKGQVDILKADGSVNLTKLAQLRNENPQLAKELAAKHGINL